jgi:phosphoglycerate dehydrogenase-like enzyme
MATQPVLVLSEQAQTYARLLEEAGVASLTAGGVAALGAEHAGCAVALGEPHLLAAALPALPGLRWAQSTWAGVTPLLPAAAAGLQVTGVREVFGAQMAEYVLGYLLAHELRVLERMHWQRERQWQPALSGSLAGKTLGIMGTGSIGSAIARSASAFGLNLLGYSRSGAAVEPFSAVFGPGGLQAFLGQLDYLVSVLPHTSETQGLLGARAFAAMRAGTVLVNVGRGSVVDEHALADALDSGHLGAAVLDVFQQEPLPAGHRFWNTPRLVITAHVAAHSYPADIAALFLDNYVRWQQGQPLLHRLDAQRGY